MNIIKDKSVLYRLPKFGLGISGVKTENEGMEMVCIIKCLSDWPSLYDAVLEKVGDMMEKKLKRTLSIKLKSWEDENIPRLLELRSHFMADEIDKTELLGVSISTVRVRNLETEEKRRPLLEELLRMFADLFDILEMASLFPGDEAISEEAPNELELSVLDEVSLSESSRPVAKSITP